MADEIKDEKTTKEESEATEDVAPVKEASATPDEGAEEAEKTEEITGTENETPAEVAAVNTDNETAKEAEEEKPAPSGKFADLITQIENLSVLELSELVKELENRFGVSAAAPVAVAAAPAAAGGAEAAAEEKSEYTVVLQNSGDQKIAVIKVIREIRPDLGLKEAKDLVDTAPKEVKANVPKDEAQEAKKKLEAAGATVELK